MSAETVTYSRLSGASGVTALVGTRIYPDVLPEDCAYPAVMFGRQATEPVFGVSGAKLAETATLRIECWAESRSEADAVAAAVEAAMNAAGDPPSDRQAGYDIETGLQATVLTVPVFVAT